MQIAGLFKRAVTAFKEFRAEERARIDAMTPDERYQHDNAMIIGALTTVYQGPVSEDTLANRVAIKRSWRPV